MYWVQRGLPIGEWRVIENVTIPAAGGQYRTTNHLYKMTIRELTDVSIFLSLANYEYIRNETLKTSFLIGNK